MICIWLLKQAVCCYFKSLSQVDNCWYSFWVSFMSFPFGILFLMKTCVFIWGAKPFMLSWVNIFCLFFLTWQILHFALRILKASALAVFREAIETALPSFNIESLECDMEWNDSAPKLINMNTFICFSFKQKYLVFS